MRIIYISTRGDLIKGVTTLNRVKKRLPQMTREGMRRWGKILAKDLKRAARMAGIKDYTGTLQTTGIRYEQGKRSDKGFMFMRIYGIYLDSMAPHFVSIHGRRTRLLGWARRAISPALREKAMMIDRKELRRFTVFVKPHPFIAQGYRKARPKLRPVMKRLTKRAIKAS